MQALEKAMERELAEAAVLREQLTEARSERWQDRQHDGLKIQRREHQVELAAAHVSASKVRLRLCAESRDFSLPRICEITYSVTRRNSVGADHKRWWTGPTARRAFADGATGKSSTSAFQRCLGRLLTPTR